MILGMYDVSGIQNFIFSSPKLKENIGASLLVQKIFEKDLLDIIKKLSDNEKILEKDWWKYSDFRMLQDSSIPMEVIYIGGGNALIAYRNKEYFDRVTKELAKCVYEKSYSLLKVSSAFAEVMPDNANFSEVMKKLQDDLRSIKAKIFQSLPLTGIGINATSSLDGFALEYGKENSIVAEKKLEAYGKYKSEYEKRLKLPEEMDGLQWPVEFDHINPVEAKRYIAVVHIDGNSMGKTIQNSIGDEPDFEKAVLLMRELSRKISRHYEDAMKNTIEFLRQKLQATDYVTFDKNEKETLKDYLNIEKYFPLRILILNGDDVTFVTHGKLGIPLAKKFLEEVEKVPLNLMVNGQSKAIEMSACAGVAVVKSHFPFYRAYELSEDLISSAKNKAKKKARKEGANGSEKVPSALDVHVIQSGITTDLETIRKKYYTRDNEPLQARPWIINQSDLGFFQYEEAVRYFLDKDKGWPRSRLKALRNAMLTSQEEKEVVKLSAESRNYQWPGFDDKIIFDAVELMDMYVHL